MNLLKNAIIHNHPDGELIITVSSSSFTIENTSNEPALARDKLFDRFHTKNKHIYLGINPKLVLVVPVQTIDYWMKCVDEKKSDCHNIRQIERIAKNNIKIETYGKSNVYNGWAINPESINSKIEKINGGLDVLEKLRCLSSFRDFENQFKI